MLGHPDERPLGHPGREASPRVGIRRAQEGREDVVGGELVDDRRHRLDAALDQLRAAHRPHEALELEAGDLGQGIGVASPGPLAVGGPEPSEDAVVDEAGQPSLGDPQVAIGEQRGELGRHDVGLDEPEQERPVALGQGAPGGDAGSSSDQRPTGRRQPSRTPRRARLRRACADR